MAKRQRVDTKPANGAPLFGEIKVLKRFKDQEAARALLTRAAEEVQGVMARRGWRVPELREFLPKNDALLGLNVNRGACIKVRLRYRSGSFYPYPDVLGTLLHELVHNEISPHDKKFFALLDTLWNEVESGGGGGGGVGGGATSASVPLPFQGQGFQTGGAPKPRSEEQRRRAMREAAERRARNQKLSSGGGQRLGGGPSGDSLTPSALRDRIRRAAERRRFAPIICGSGSAEGAIEVLDERDSGEEGAEAANPRPEATAASPWRSAPRPGAGWAPRRGCCAACCGDLPEDAEVSFLGDLLAPLARRGDAEQLRLLRVVTRNLLHRHADARYRRVNLTGDDGKAMLGGGGAAEACARTFLGVVGFEEGPGEGRLTAPALPALDEGLLRAAEEALSCALRRLKRGAAEEEGAGGKAGAGKEEGAAAAAGAEVIDLTSP